jgi:hypothetical protein
MSVVLRADDVAAGARSEYFHEVVGAAVGPLEVREGDGNACPTRSAPPTSAPSTSVSCGRPGRAAPTGPGGTSRR